jgi:nucleotide-binding universal stress UspA family protein
MPRANETVMARGAARRATGRPVVVAIGATGGTQSVRMGRAIADRNATEIVVVSVVEPPPLYTFETTRAVLLPWLVEQQLGERRESVHDRLRQLGFEGGRHDDPRLEVRYGDSAPSIGDVARDLNARLIVMGIGPHSVRHRLLPAGTAWSTGRRALCATLAVAAQARELPHVAVVATDFSPESIHAARAALPLLADDGIMYVVHAWSRVEAAFPHAALAASSQHYVASLSERFMRLREALAPPPGVTVHDVAIEGRPADLVLSVARAKQADLIVAGTHGRGAVERWLLGSTSSALLRRADCSVLLAPPPIAA